jgi:2-oxoisovalerate dehydrogenase E2 component (dihydrolipoyl transacylase)
VAVQEFRLPDPGEGLVEAEIVTWRVAVGDQVEVNDIVVEVETSKSLVELPSPYAGTVTALLAEEGELVDVGRAIITIDDDLTGGEGGAGEGAGAEAEAASASEAEAPAENLVPDNDATAVDATVESADLDEGGDAPGGRVAVLVGYGPRTGEAKRRPRKAVKAEARAEALEQTATTFSTTHPVSRRADVRDPLPPDQARPVGAPLPGPGAAGAEPEPVRTEILAKPPVRKLAKDLGVDLASVTGTGPGGVITRDDVTQASRPQPATRPEPVEGPRPELVEGEDIRIPIRGVRRATAQAMVQSAFTAPHVTEWVTCDVSATVELVERLRERREFADIKVSPMLIVAKAALLALQRTPELNSSWDEAAGEIVIKRRVHLGIAAATPRGLLVPNIKGADAMSLPELGRATGGVASTARAGTTQPADTAGGTFTITNVGVFGVDAGTPILNPGEAGILCFGQIARRPWVVGSGADERIEPRWVTTLAVSFDHRLVDGEQGSRFLSDVAGILSDPGLALLY